MAQEHLPEIPLKDITKELREAVDAFEADWVKNREATPDRYPEGLPGPEWVEQFIFFLSGYEPEPEKG